MLVGKKNTLVSGNLTVSIVGDSFTEYYKNTYLELLCEFLNLKVIDHIGFPGGSQYKIYKAFIKQLNKKPDVMICVHTNASRLYHDTYGINRVSISKKLEEFSFSNKEVYDAADKYYKYLYNEESSNFTYNLTIKEMQQL